MEESDVKTNLAKGFAAQLSALPKVRYTFECGDDKLAHWHVRHFELEEGISTPYCMVLDLTTKQMEVEPSKMLGDSCSLLIDRTIMQRTVLGVIDQVISVGVSAGCLCLRVRVVPALSLLQQRNNTRTWQDQTVPEILKLVLEDALKDYRREVRFDLTTNYAKRDFCVQYRESDFEFVSRLMEEEGISYYFEHSSEGKSEVMVLIDENASDPELEVVGGEEIPIIDTQPGSASVESIQDFEWCCTLHTTSVVQRDYTWIAPREPIVSENRGADDRGRERENYEPEERRLHEVLAGARTVSMIEDNPRQAQLKRELLAVQGKTARGKGNVVEFTPGYTFVLEGHYHPELDRKYLLTKVHHVGDMPEENILEGAVDGGGERYENFFECIPVEVPFRPARVHPRPKIYGPQMAIVTGPSGEEVHTDEHGRIKILFRWDRLSAADDSSSFWVRVAQNWAGPGWGTWFLPRIGMEVVVEFLDGNPDRPLVTGCVYNGVNNTPYELPAEKTKSTIKSNSSLGGDGFNEFRFEDRKGNEEIYLHGQKDWNIEILNDKNQTIGHDETGAVGHNRTRQVGNDEQISVGHNRTRMVGNDEQLTIGNNRTRQVGNNEMITIGVNQTENVGSNRTTSVGINDSTSVGANQSLNVGANQSVNVGASQSVNVASSQSLGVGGAQSVQVGLASTESVGLAKMLTVGAMYQVSVGAAMNLTVGLSHTEQVGKVKQITAGDKITLKCGSSEAVLNKDGTITLKGVKFVVEGSDSAKVKAGVINLN